jgi:hypothetical protein
MSEASNDVSNTPAPRTLAQSPDLGSAQAAVVVGTLFIAVVGAVMLVGGLYRRYPILMTVFTLAVIIAGVLVIT